MISLIGIILLGIYGFIATAVFGLSALVFLIPIALIVGYHLAEMEN